MDMDSVHHAGLVRRAGLSSPSPPGAASPLVPAAQKAQRVVGAALPLLPPNVVSRSAQALERPSARVDQIQFPEIDSILKM